MKKVKQSGKMLKAASCIYFSAILFVSVLVLSGCSENGDPVDANGGTAKVAGKVTDTGGFAKIAKTTAAVNGASIILVKVKSNGELETVSKNEVTTDADGKFLIETDVNGEANLMIVAKKGNKEWKGIVTSKVKTGITVYSQPLNEETTAEADVYVRARAQGNKNVLYSDVAAYINASTAAEIKNSSETSGRIASSLDTKTDIHARAVSNTSFNGSEHKWNLVLSGAAEAQAELERDLFYAESDAAVEAAFNAYFKNMVQAYVNAGMSADAYFRATEISNKVYIKSIASVSGRAQFELKKSASIVKAKILSAAVNSRFTAMGASSSRLSVLANASANLNTSIKNASDENQIKAAFESYNSIVIDELKASLGTNAHLLGSMESKLLNFRSSLQASITGSISNDALINAYINFCSNIRTEVETVLSAANKNDVDAAVSLLIIVNMNV